MSLFKTKAIILEIKKQSKENHLYFVFSADYWKILVTKKFRPKEKNLDIWYNINCEIEVSQNQDVHKIKNIKILNQFDYSNQDYNIIISYLELIWLLNKHLQSWITNPAFYEIINKINTVEKLDKTKIVLAKLKIMHQLWILNPCHKEQVVCKILKFISENNINKILLLKGIDDKILQDLENIIKLSEISQ